MHKAPPVVRLGDLMSWCEQHSQFPGDPNQAFVLSHICSNVEEDKWFRFVISTPHLLDKFKDVEKVCIDSTYKLTWHGFPLTILGTVDRSKKFHPIAYACTTHEKTEDYHFVFESVKIAIEKYFGAHFQPKILISDAADAIRNAFYKAFKSAEIDVMCFAHVLRNINKRKFVSLNNKQLINGDIKKMQLAPDKATFKMMADLFCDKWISVETEFVNYFKKQWLGIHCNWYEGAAEYCPSTNNAQESYNAIIKKKVTMRKRLPMGQFLACMLKMASGVSLEFHKGDRIVASEPSIDKEIFQRALLMVQNAFKAFKVKRTAVVWTLF